MAQAADCALGGIQPFEPNIEISEATAIQAAPGPSLEGQICRQPFVIPLPQGKEYHVFFSHSSEDANEVEKMVETLEKAPYNITCCYDKRDFTAGKRIIDNVNHFIAASVKTVVVLSPDFIQSQFCELEMTLAQTISLAEKQNAVVPVVLRNCPIPDSLKVLNHIIAEEEDVCAKIVKALQNDQQNQLNPFKIWMPPIEYLNGSFLLIPGVKGSAVGKPLLGCQFQPLTVAQKRDLKNMDIKISETEFEKLIQIVNESNVVRYRYSSYLVQCLVTLATMFPVVGLTFVIVYSCYGDFSDQAISNIMTKIPVIMIMLSVLGFYGSYIPCVIFAFNKLSSRYYRNRIAIINNTYYKKNYCIQLLYRKNFPTLAVCKYDCELCRVYLLRKLRQIRMQTEIQGIAEEEEEEKYIINKCETLIKTHLSNYIEDLLENKFQVGGSRHRMQGNWPCLCQYVESKHREDNMQLLGCVDEPPNGVQHQRPAAENFGNRDNAEDLEPLLP